jgi:hypothetical protein
MHNYVALSEGGTELTIVEEDGGGEVEAVVEERCRMMRSCS